jgi:excisionase family DNA binding protein
MPREPQLAAETLRPTTERLLTLSEAAKCLGVPYWQLQRAVRSGIVPSYAPFNSRRLVYLSELMTFVAATRHGG